MLNVCNELFRCQKLFIAISTYKKGCCVRDNHKRNGLKFDDAHAKYHKDQRIYDRDVVVVVVVRVYSGDGRTDGRTEAQK